MKRRTIYTTPDFESAISRRVARKHGDDVFSSVSDIVCTLVARHDAIIHASLPAMALPQWRLVLAGINAMQLWTPARKRDPGVLAAALDDVCSGRHADLLETTGTTMVEACGLAGRLHRMPLVQLAAIHDVYERMTTAGVRETASAEDLSKLIGNGAILREEETT